MRELTARFRKLTDRPRLYEIVLIHGRVMEVFPLTLSEEPLLAGLRSRAERSLRRDDVSRPRGQKRLEVGG